MFYRYINNTPSRVISWIIFNIFLILFFNKTTNYTEYKKDVLIKILESETNYETEN